MPTIVAERIRGAERERAGVLGVLDRPSQVVGEGALLPGEQRRRQKQLDRTVRARDGRKLPSGRLEGPIRVLELLEIVVVAAEQRWWRLLQRTAEQVAQGTLVLPHVTQDAQIELVHHSQRQEATVHTPGA